MKKFINFRPITFLAAGLACGIASVYFFITGIIAAGIIISALFLFSIILGIIYGAKNGKLKVTVFFIIIITVLSSISAVIFSVQVSRYENATLDEMTLSVNGRVKSVAAISGGYSLVLDEVEVSGAVNGKAGYDLCVYSYGSTEFEIGDILNFTAGIRERTVVYDGRFSSGAIASGVKYFAILNDEEITVTGNRTTIFEKINLAIKSVLSRGLNKDEFGVAYALLCGNSDFMDEEVLTSYRDAGVAHVFAVSGLHIGFIATVIGFFLKRQKRLKWLTYIISAILLFGYSGICGFTVSSIRAAVMSMVFMLSFMTGNAYDVLSSLSLAAAFILFIFPTQLLCVGFQLSFAVVLGIILLSRPISKIFGFLPKKLSSGLGAVLSAQIVSFPICLYAFGKVSFFAIFANLIFVPIVGVIFISLILCVILGGIFSPTVFLFVHNYVFKFSNLIFTSVSYEPFLIGGFTLGAYAIFYYAALFICSGLLNVKRITTVITASFLLFTAVLGTTTHSLKDSENIKLKVIGGSGLSVTMIDTKSYDAIFVCAGTGAFSVSPIRRLFPTGAKAKVDALFILNSTKGNDALHMVSRIHTVLNFENLIYPEKVDIPPQVISKSFPDIKAICLEVGDGFAVKDFGMEFMFDGFIAKINTHKKNVYISSYFSDSFDSVNRLNITGADVIICGNYAEQIYKAYNPKKLITYRKSNIFSDGESKGAFTYRLA